MIGGRIAGLPPRVFAIAQSPSLPARISRMALAAPAWHPGGIAEDFWMRAIFVMLKCEMGHSYRVAQLAADTVAELSELHSTSGQYDLLGKFYLEPEQDTGLFVTEKLQTLPGVKDTYTLITFNAFVGR
jgi:DNA-binding Lrp family transcriptional regulator